LLDGKPSLSGRFAFTSYRLWKKDDPLAEFGLLGAVTLRTARRVVVESCVDSGTSPTIRKQHP